MEQAGKVLILLGLTLIVVGLVLWFWPKLGLGSLPLGRLPGDIYIDKGNTKFYFPITSGILLSIFLSGLSYLFRKFFG
jgi:hypothetical protein